MENGAALMGVRGGRSAGVSLGLIAATICVGLAVRFAPLGLPGGVAKYGGSALWALMLYWILSAVMPVRGVVQAGLATGVVATAVEFFKLYESPGLHAFRHTLAGVLLLGRVFSVWDLVAYWGAIVGGALLDRWLRRIDC